MKPNDQFSLLKRQAFLADYSSLSLLYQPIMGADAFLVYHFLLASYEQGLSNQPFSRILNHLDLGMNRLEQALDVLTALDLLDVYNKQEVFLLELKAPLAEVAFMSKPLLKQLLRKKIGDFAMATGQQSPDSSWQKVSKKFSDVFSEIGQVKEFVPARKGFDWDAFRNLMRRDKLAFQDEAEDVIALTHLADSLGLSWLELYQLAKETAVQHQISLGRLQSRLQQGGESGQLSRQEEAILAEAKSKSSLEFLRLLKASRKAGLLDAERSCLASLAKEGHLDEVINVAVLYTFNKIDSANLNTKYLVKLVNEFSYKGIHSAKAAILFLRENRQATRTRTQARTKTSSTSNVPEWSKQEVKTEQTIEGQAQLADLYRQFEEMENKGGGQ
ncbi:TPA: replication initiation/membrane attachment protein [Streptococcus suis]|nr:replication initiation/membrane attachment protein [Streptococcus suis]